MITFVLAVALLVGALCVGAALEGVTTEAPPGGCRIACPGRRTARESHGAGRPERLPL